MGIAERGMKTILDHYGYAFPGIHGTVTEMRSWLLSVHDAPSDIEKHGLWSCHSICRVAHTKWGLARAGWKVKDGYFSRSYQHTWLMRESGMRSMLILDVYPVASGGCPLLIEAGDVASPWLNLYVEDPRVYERKREQIDRETVVLAAL